VKFYFNIHCGVNRVRARRESTFGKVHKSQNVIKTTYKIEKTLVMMLLPLFNMN